MGQSDVIRLSIFGAMFLLMAVWEAIAPVRDRAAPRWLRWGNNVSLLLVGNALLRLAIPVTAIGFAGAMQQEGSGMLNTVAMPEVLAFVLAVAVLDMGIYFQHRIFHAVPVLWRLHRVHHADTEFDVSTALRFHPFEMAISLLFKLGMIALLGPSPAAVLTFEVLLNAGAMFNHANVRLPSGADGFLRAVIVTPDMHRIHHSVNMREANSNFGFSLSLWDKLFGSYRNRSEAPQETMAIGVSNFRGKRNLWLDRLLLQPFAARDTPAR